MGVEHHHLLPAAQALRRGIAILLPAAVPTNQRLPQPVTLPGSIQAAEGVDARWSLHTSQMIEVVIVLERQATLRQMSWLNCERHELGR